ncbi:MAG: IclR family transcriptional regulator [Candidatus Dormibacteraeota bacterium]|nr:IclR family transcriptional regulator [Candidatus Dormibacteraeota bacterium]MBV9525084.1 IclR family transcriptional regulator [Candidatus Dormibacteraeota bacterium]
MDVLLLFESVGPVLGAPEVSERLRMSRSTTYRYLQSLRSYDLLEEAEDGRGFRLGPRVLRLAKAVRQGLGVPEVALPIMRELMLETDETVLLTRRSGANVVCVERVSSQHPIRLSYERGHIVPVHAGASAKVLLAYADPSEVDELLKNPLPRLTKHSVTEPAKLRRQLEQIRREGFAVSHGEADANVTGIAAPIRDGADRVVAALSIAGVDFRIVDEAIPRLTACVVRAAQQISDRLADGHE